MSRPAEECDNKSDLKYGYAGERKKLVGDRLTREFTVEGVQRQKSVTTNRDNLFSFQLIRYRIKSII